MNDRKPKIAMATLLLLGVCCPLQSEDDAESTGSSANFKRVRFNERDTDRNGSLSLEEFIADRSHIENAEKGFYRLDVDGNGQLSWKEFLARWGNKKDEESGEEDSLEE